MNSPSNRPAASHPFAVRAAHWVGRNWARVHYARRVEPTWLELNPHAIGVSDLPVSFAGFKIAQMSDFHGGHHLPDDFLRRAVDMTLAEQPDAITLTGDFIHKGYKHIEGVAKILGRLQAAQGIFAVLGNHDFSVRNALGIRRHRGLHKAVADALAGEGIRVLRNESLQLVKEGSQLSLAGVDDLWSRECDLEQALRDLCPRAPRIVLAHNPRTVHLLGEHRCDLMLSGHTHGGQVNWPGLGRFFLGRKARQFAAGLYRHKSTHVYVNKGVGFGWRFRFGVRPEIAVFTLHRGQHGG
jgi:uncharacterized protein